MGNKLRHEGDEVRIKVIWPDRYYVYHRVLILQSWPFFELGEEPELWGEAVMLP